MTTTTDITGFLTDWTDAELAGERRLLDPLLADDFVGVGPYGFTLTKPEWLSRHEQGLRYDTFALDETMTRIHGDSALVTARQEARGNYNGQPVPEATRVTLAIVNEGGRCQLGGVHISIIAAPPQS
jgi:hypothetical protein